MDKFNKLEEKYKPIIENILKDNKRFYQFENTVTWQYIVNNDKAVIASCGKDLILRINIVAISYMEEINEPLLLEFFILHELRHMFQRLCVMNPKNNIPHTEIWQDEFNNYVNMYEDRESYYYQKIEFDAYSFSYAVMLYKYGKVNYIYPPHIYDDDYRFSNAVNAWLNHFKTNHY